jgi:hypothetical protein
MIQAEVMEDDNIPVLSQMVREDVGDMSGDVVVDDLRVLVSLIFASRYRTDDLI